MMTKVVVKVVNLLRVPEFQWFNGKGIVYINFKILSLLVCKYCTPEVLEVFCMY